MRRSRRIWSQAIFTTDWCGHTWRFFSPIAAMWQFSKPCDKIAQPDGLALLAIRSNKRRKSRDWARLANAGEFIADIWHARYRRFYTPIAAIGQNRNRCTGHTWRFSPIAAIGENRQVCPVQRYKIARCVAGFSFDLNEINFSSQTINLVTQFLCKFPFIILNSIIIVNTLTFM